MPKLFYDYWASFLCSLGVHSLKPHPFTARYDECGRCGKLFKVI